MNEITAAVGFLVGITLNIFVRVWLHRKGKR
jgi:hypothetical protein